MRHKEYTCYTTKTCKKIDGDEWRPTTKSERERERKE